MTILCRIVDVQNNEASLAAGVCAKCKISNKNIIAFSYKSKNGDYEVCVMDIVTPWTQYKVCTSKDAITTLEWSSTGELLMVVHDDGTVEIWTFCNKVLNAWTMLYYTQFSHEKIIGTQFFHNGKCLHFNTQKRDAFTYSEKFERVNYRPTLTGLGRAPLNGYLVVTASGLLGVVVFPKLPKTPDNGQATELKSVNHVVGFIRCYVLSCSISHCPKGGINIALNNGYHEKRIQCFKVLLKMESNELKVHCEMRSNIFLPSKDQTQSITHIKWVTFNTENIIFVVYESSEGSRLEQWNLCEKPQGLHKLLQKNKSDILHNENWLRVASLNFPTGIKDICVSKMPQDNFQVFVILKDSTIQVLEFGLKNRRLISTERLVEERNLKMNYLCCDVTFAAQALLVFDSNGQMYALHESNAPPGENNFKLYSLSWQVSLLEYCILTGIDASDVLILNLVSLELLIEKLTENFSRQSTIVKQFYYSNFLALKSNMCRIQSKQQDFDNLIILHSISITFKSLLRPADLNCQEKGPADCLSSIIMSDSLVDVDSVLLNLDAKDFTVEPMTLQSLQGCMQWVADLALQMLKRLPEDLIKRSKLGNRQGYDINKDTVAINSIRELIVMIRIWGLLNQQCLPSYVKCVDNVDVLSVIFRLLTRLVQNVNEPDDMLLDECSTLAMQVLVPPRMSNTPTTLLNDQTPFYKSVPAILSSTIAITDKSFVQDHLPHDEFGSTSFPKDGVTNLHLGSRIASIRRCNHCGFSNNLYKVAKTSALKAWCNRWIFCHCGAYWVIENNLKGSLEAKAIGL